MITYHFSQFDKAASQGLFCEFILHEYAEALQSITSLQNAPAVLALRELERLVMPLMKNALLFKPGILDKLFFYCDTLLQAIKIDREEILTALDEIRAMVSLQRSRLLRKSSLVPYPLTPSLPFPQFSNLRGKLHLFFFQLIPLVQGCRESETTLFTLLELRQLFNDHLGSATVENLLRDLFPLGPNQLREKLALSFERRGFSHFFRQHEKLFEGLTWNH